MAAKLMLLNVLSFLCNTLLRKSGNPTSFQWKTSNAHASHLKFQKFTSLAHLSEELPCQILIFHTEGALLKSSSLFPYFMLVAFEAGGLVRALILLLLYPFFCLVGEELWLKIMVFLCFFGIREEKFRIGTAVLPKFFLEGVGHEGFDVVMRFGRRVGVSDLPRIMVEGFLKDYLGVEVVLGRELKVVGGYFIGLMEEKKVTSVVLNEILGEEKMDSHVIGIGSFNKPLDEKLSSHCKNVYLVNEAEKRNWESLPREKYPKPLIFHDGRLAFSPTPLATLGMFMWLPLGFLLFIIRFAVGRFLPYSLSNPILALTGMRTTTSIPKPSNTSTTNEDKSWGVLYVCNHRTLLDPLSISLALNKPLFVVTYGLSRFSEIISPARTVRLTRDRETDKKLMDSMLSQGNLVVCPEGTTCREPYLLRFSPLFAEMSDQIVPVAIDVQVGMLHGSTAGGFKCLDPVIFFMNPYPSYFVKILEELPGSYSCNVGGKTQFEVANHVQNEIAKALGFRCTSFTRKDKYLILAGNDGIMEDHKRVSVEVAKTHSTPIHTDMLAQ